MGSLANRVRETSTSTGTGAFTLLGAVAGFESFHVGFPGVNPSCYYVIEAVDAAGLPTGAWEVGLGVKSVSNELTRGVIASSNADALVNFTAGTKNVFCSPPSSLFDTYEAQTPAQILTALLTVDGAGSGLDADLLDGLSSAAFQPVDADLTTIAALTATTDSFMQAKAGAWEARTIAQVKTDLGLTGTNSGDQTITLTGAVTGSGSGTFATTYGDAEILALSGLVSAADKLPYFTGSGTASLADLSAFGRTLIDDAAATNARTTLGLVIGTDVQAQGATLASLEGLALVSGDILYATAADTLARLPKGADGEFLRLAAGIPDWEAIASGGDALVANPLSQFAATTSLQLKGVLSDETGSGALVFATSPTLVTPALGVATATSINGATITSGTLNGSVTGSNTGDQTITLTGDVTGSGTGTFAATIANAAVTLAKMADMATASLIYRKTAGAGVPEVNTLATLKTDLVLVKGDVGLGSVDNTTDAGKPVSTAQQTALDLKANLASPTFTGNPLAPTPTSGDNDTSIATTAFVKAAIDERKATISFIIDGGGAAITTGVKGYLEIPFACTIDRATALADQSGSIVVDIWKDTYANYPPVDADSITASAPVTITTATKSQDATLTGWTTAVAAGDVLGFNVDSITTCQRVTISLRAVRT